MDAKLKLISSFYLRSPYISITGHLVGVNSVNSVCTLNNCSGKEIFEVKKLLAELVYTFVDVFHRSMK